MIRENRLEEQLSFNELRPAAERTLLQDVKVSPELQQRILRHISADTESVQRRMKSDSISVRKGRKSYLPLVIALTLIFGAALVVMGLLNSENPTRKQVSAVETSVIKIVPLMALSALSLTKTQNLPKFEALPRNKFKLLVS